MRKFQIFCHVATVGSWKSSIGLIKNYINDSNILLDSDCEKITFCVNGSLEEVKSVVKTKYDKEHIIHLQDHYNFFEFPTLNYLREYCIHNDINVLYIHTKGSSYADDTEHKNYCNLWLAQMMEGCVLNYKNAINHINNNHDHAGMHYATLPFKHYSGNFWWAKSEHIKKLIKLDYTNRNFNFETGFPFRHDAEKWLCSVDGIYANLGTFHSMPMQVQSI